MIARVRPSQLAKRFPLFHPQKKLPMTMSEIVTLGEVVRLREDKVALPEKNPWQAAFRGPTLVVLAAGKGSRFGDSPKCVQSIAGIPLARHSVNEFRIACRRLANSPLCRRRRDASTNTPVRSILESIGTSGISMS